MNAPVKCRRCDQMIIFELTFKGSRVPLNYPPEKRMIMNEEGRMVVVDTYVSHFATCPEADAFRRGRSHD